MTDPPDRRKLRPLAEAVCLVAMAMAAAGCDKPKPVQTEGVYLVFVGDSLTEQKGYPEACVTALRRSQFMPDVQWDRFAAGGLAPDDMLERLRDGTWDPQPRPGPVNLAVVLAGTNGYYIGDVHRLAHDLQQRGFAVLVLTTPPRMNPGEKSWGFPQANFAHNERLRRRFPPVQPGLPHGIHRVETVPPLLDPARADARRSEYLNPAYAADHTHLNRPGYAILGQTVADAVLRAFEPPEPPLFPDDASARPATVPRAP